MADSSRIPIGYISRAHGINGEVVVASDSSDDVFVAGRHFVSDRNEVLTVHRVRQGKHGRIVAFAEVHDRTSAETLRGRTLTIAAEDRRPLGDDEFWPEDLIGMEVVNDRGRRLGTVSEVELGEAQDRLVVETSAGVVHVPFVDDLVPEVDSVARVITVTAPAGLFSEAE